MEFYFQAYVNIICLSNQGPPDMSGGPREPRHQCPTCTESGKNLIWDNKRGLK